MSKKWKIGIIIIVLLVAGALYDWKLGGNARVYVKWAECGNRPLISNPTWVMEGMVPHYGQVPLVNGLSAGKDLFCTPLEAERAGYSYSVHQWQFPGLDKLNEPWPLHIWYGDRDEELYE